MGVLVFWECSQSVAGFIPAAKNLVGEGKKSLLAPSLGRKGNLELHHLRNPGGDVGCAPCPYTPQKHPTPPGMDVGIPLTQPHGCCGVSGTHGWVQAPPWSSPLGACEPRRVFLPS